MDTIMVCGVHGVGKSRFIRDSRQFDNYSKYSCSQLIKEYSGLEFVNKQVSDVDANQNILLKATQYFVKEESVLYDGHITLFNKNKEIDTIELNVFKELNIKHFVMLKASPNIIYERLLSRDGDTWLTKQIIEIAQETEELKVIEYSNEINATYEVFCWHTKKNMWISQ